jgi:hypothetical protein
MSTISYTISQYDSARSLSYTLLVGDTAIDLTNATASLNISDRINGTRNVPVTVVSAQSGSVSYDLVLADSAVAGTSYLQFQIDFDDGTRLNVPTEKILMNVVPSVGGSVRAFL